MELLEAVFEACVEIETNISLPNCGGCAVVAAALGKWLEKHGPTTIAVGGSKHSNASASITEARPLVDSNVPTSWNEVGIEFYHVVVEFTDVDGQQYHIDSSGVHPARLSTNLGGYPIVDGRLTVEECEELANCRFGWNWIFDRNQIPKLRTIVHAAEVAFHVDTLTQKAV